METQEITIRVPSEVARFYESASKEKRQKLDALLGIWLREAEQPSRPLEEIMRDASDQARRNGLTPERLRAILNE
jgi:hypothetical protein